MKRHAAICTSDRVSIIVFAGESVTVNHIEDKDTDTLPTDSSTIYTPDPEQMNYNADYLYTNLLEACTLLRSKR